MKQFDDILSTKFLFFIDEYSFQGAIAKAGGVKALVDLIFKWSASSDGVLVCILL